MKITQITDQHLINRIEFFKRVLAEKPDPSVHEGISDYGDDWVEQENRHNEGLADEIKAHIKYLKQEARKRGLTQNKTKE